MSQQHRQSQNSRQEAIDDRLSKLEKQNASLYAEQHATRSDLEKLTISVDRLSQQVGEWMRNSGRLNLGWVIGGVGLLATIGTLAASPFVRDQARTEIDVRQLERDVAGILATRWSEDDQVQFRDRVDRSVERSEARLEARLDAIGEELTGHMANGHPHTVLDKLSALEKTLDEAREELRRRGEWMTSTTVGLAESDAGFEARLSDLEREIREISAEQRRRTERVYE